MGIFFLFCTCFVLMANKDGDEIGLFCLLSLSFFSACSTSEEEPLCTLFSVMLSFISFTISISSYLFRSNSCRLDEHERNLFVLIFCRKVLMVSIL